MASKPKHAEKGIFQKRNINAAAVFASLSNETRLRCLYLAARHDEVCVCEAVEALGISQPTISKAFRSLKDAGLVSDRRDSNWTYYRLNHAGPGWVTEIVNSTVAGLSKADPYRADAKRFERSTVRASKAC